MGAVKVKNPQRVRAHKLKCCAPTGNGPPRTGSGSATRSIVIFSTGRLTIGHLTVAASATTLHWLLVPLRSHTSRECSVGNSKLGAGLLPDQIRAIAQDGSFRAPLGYFLDSASITVPLDSQSDHSQAEIGKGGQSPLRRDRNFQHRFSVVLQPVSFSDILRLAWLGNSV